MTSDRAIRASDEDRERAAAALGGHFAAGRLTLEEFQERLNRAYAAKTLGELADLMTDLPRTDLRQLRGQPGSNPLLPEPRPPGTIQARDGSLTAFWRVCLAVTIGVFVLWLVSGPGIGPWFLLAAIALAFVILRRRRMRTEHRIRNHHQTRQ
jgi:Flp pilus assembly protein TadB